MEGIQKKEGKNKKPVIRYMVYILLIEVMVTGVAFSRCATTLQGTDLARIAVFDYRIDVELNSSDPRIRDTDKGFTGGTFSLSGSTQDTSFDVSIYATVKLEDADECEFDDVARVVDVTFSNDGEVTVNAAIESMTEIAGTGYKEGMVWCLFTDDEFDTAKGVYENILRKLGYVDVSGDGDLTQVPDNYTALQAALRSENTATLADWNNNAVRASGTGTKTLTFVFWAEHDGAEVYSNYAEGANGLTQEIMFKFNVIQVD